MMKVLFDSSCSYAVLAPEIEPGVNSQFPSQSEECKYYTGVYLRMEFMRRWVMTGIELYMAARNLEDLNVAVEYFGNSFSAREVKAVLKWVNRFNKVTQCESVSEPIERFGWEVYNFALAYDMVFKHFVQQKTGCKRGIVEFDLATTTRRKALYEFYERFAETDFACNLDELLKLSGGYPKLRPLLDAEPKSFPIESRRGFKKLQGILSELVGSGEAPDCAKCYKIGDILIALEQPPKTILYHTDHSFSAICPALKHEHKLVKSQRALLRDSV